MDPTVALPLHFTIETAVLSASGLVVAWAVLRRRWIAAVGAALLTVGQGLHAGQYVAPDDDPLLLVLRGVGFAVLAAGVLVDRAAIPSPRLFMGGVGALVAGTIWGGVAGGDASDLDLVAHLLLLAGALVALAWVWRASRPSIRLRLLAAFVSVLAVTVVVAGGAVARAATLDSRRAEFERLGRDAASVFRHVNDTHDAVRRRAAAASPAFSLPVQRGDVSVEGTGLFPREWQVVLDRQGRALDDAVAPSAWLPRPPSALGTTPLFAAAVGGEVTSTDDVTPQGLSVMAAAPVYRAGSAQRPADVIGVVVLGRGITPDELRAAADDDRVDVVVADEDATASSDARLRRPGVASASRGVEFVDIEGAEQQWFGAVSALPTAAARVVVAVPADDVTEGATSLVRAFLTAILAATLLAVIAALWLSARITRPMLDLADQAERAKSDFLASISHELRTPLTPIRGYTEILRRGRVPARDRSEYLDEIGQATQRLERIVALLVDVASLEAGRFYVDVEDVAPAELLAAAAERWEPRVGRRRIDVAASRDLPAVKADPSAIGRVLDELIDNALKFAPNKPVVLSAERTGEGVDLSVRDEGPGMDEAAARSATEAFSQADSGDTRQFGGLGLGLTFVEGVLREHNSVLRIDTSPGEGTTCSFTLPAAGSVTRMPAKVASRKR